MLRGGEFVMPTLRLCFAPGHASVLLLCTNRVAHGTAPVLPGGTLERIGSGIYYSYPVASASTRNALGSSSLVKEAIKESGRQGGATAETPSQVQLANKALVAARGAALAPSVLEAARMANFTQWQWFRYQA